mgnify:CR=1 FL=1
MKTAESSIKNDLGKFLVELAIHRISTWATKEINNIRYDENFPICLQVTNKSWAIGNFLIKNNGTHCWSLHNDGKFIHNFYSKQAAMYYAIFERMKLYNSADTLLSADQDLVFANADFDFFTAKVTKIDKNTTDFNAQLWRSRYIESRSKFILARQELEKRLLSAKYNKIWDRIL